MAEAIKPGFKTTEFWLTLLAMIVGLTTASGFIPDTSPWARLIGMVGGILSSLGYTYVRGTLKK